jgi:hypothetical protein
MGGQESIRAYIASPVRDNWTQMEACFRGPEIGIATRELRALLRSTTFSHNAA